MSVWSRLLEAGAGCRTRTRSSRSGHPWTRSSSGSRSHAPSSLRSSPRLAATARAAGDRGGGRARDRRGRCRSAAAAGWTAGTPGATARRASRSTFSGVAPGPSPSFSARVGGGDRHARQLHRPPYHRRWRAPRPPAPCPWRRPGPRAAPRSSWPPARSPERMSGVLLQALDEVQQPLHVWAGPRPGRLGAQGEVGRGSPAGQADAGEQAIGRRPGAHPDEVAQQLAADPPRLAVAGSGPGQRRGQVGARHPDRRLDAGVVGQQRPAQRGGAWRCPAASSGARTSGPRPAASA